MFSIYTSTLNPTKQNYSKLNYSRQLNPQGKTMHHIWQNQRPTWNEQERLYHLENCIINLFEQQYLIPAKIYTRSQVNIFRKLCKIMFYHYWRLVVFNNKVQIMLLNKRLLFYFYRIYTREAQVLSWPTFPSARLVISLLIQNFAY